MASESLAEDEELASIPRERSLRSKSFQGLLITQLLGAANDNILRWLVIGVGKQYVEKSQVGWILMAGTASFVLPYLLLAGVHSCNPGIFRPRAKVKIQPIQATRSPCKNQLNLLSSMT